MSFNELIFADVDKFVDHCSELNTAPGKMVNMKCVGFATILIIISLLYWWLSSRVTH